MFNSLTLYTCWTERCSSFVWSTLWYHPQNAHYCKTHSTKKNTKTCNISFHFTFKSFLRETNAVYENTIKPSQDTHYYSTEYQIALIVIHIWWWPYGDKFTMKLQKIMNYGVIQHLICKAAFENCIANIH
jgi:hypothetical protein